MGITRIRPSMMPAAMGRWSSRGSGAVWALAGMGKGLGPYMGSVGYDPGQAAALAVFAQAGAAEL